MTRSLLVPLFALALLSPGCVPVTEPLCDIDKAEPDKSLVGKWTVTNGKGFAGEVRTKTLTVDAPAVKGNPKGLMRGVAVMENGETKTWWFFLGAVGKHTYGTFIAEEVALDKEDGFAAWQKKARREYFVFQYVRDGDKLTLNWGNYDAFEKVMEGAGIGHNGGKHFRIYDTPAGWLAKYLDKSGPGKLFDGSNTISLTRDKK